MAPTQAPLRTLFTPFGSFLEHTLAQPPLPPLPPVVHLEDGVVVELLASGVLWVQPPLPATKQLIISAGIHGNETAPIELCDNLVIELLEQRWSATTPTLFVLGNPPAMSAGERFLDYNLNRLFNGFHRQSKVRSFWESGRAALLEELVRRFYRVDLPLLHTDLHTAIRASRREKFALYPFVPGRELPPQQMQFLLDCGVGTVLYQHKPASTFSAWTSTELGAESFTIELGKARPFGENDLGCCEAMENSLRNLMQGAIPQPDQYTRAAIDEFEVVHEIINTGAQFVFHIGEDVANFTEYPPGTLIWEDHNAQYRVGSVPEAIVFPNPHVTVGQRVGLMVAPAVRR